MSILTGLEAFSGYLYVSFCGAILFAKISRTASHAQVTFSDPVVIRYGSGVATDSGEDEGSEECDKPRIRTLSMLPCPVLEFRLINRLSRQRRGEIIDATLQIVASIDEKQATNSTRISVHQHRLFENSRHGSNRQLLASASGLLNNIIQ